MKFKFFVSRILKKSKAYTFFHNKMIFWIIVFLLSAASFRILCLNLIEFKLDEATTVYQTVQFFLSPHIVSRGLISGIGTYNFPLFNYLVILLAIFSKNPQTISFLIALINVTFVPIFYLIIRRYYDQITAVFATFLLAFSPWAVLFSRKIWAQDLILIFMIPILWLLHSIILEKNTKFTLPLFILLTLLTQLHGSGIFFMIATILIFLLLRTRVNIKHALLGVSLGMIPAIPYIFFQISSNPTCVDCLVFLKYQQTVRNFDIYNFIRPLQLLNGMGYHFILGNSYNGFILSFPIVGYLKYMFVFSTIFSFLGGIYILFRNRTFIFILLYTFIIPLLYFITRTQPYMHYFVILIPIMSILCAMGFIFLYGIKKTRFWQVSIILLFSFFIIVNIIFLVFFYTFLSTQKIIEGDYGPIFSVTENFIQENTKDYKKLPIYNELLSYAYIYPKPETVHSKLNEFFLTHGLNDLAAKEYNKSRD